MAKKDLSRAFLWKGATYGPGKDVEVPDDFPKDAEERIKKLDEKYAMAAQSPPGASGSGVAQEKDTVPPAGGPVIDYDSMTKAELLEETEKRGLIVTGTGADGAILKDDLVKALKG